MAANRKKRTKTRSFNDFAVKKAPSFSPTSNMSKLEGQRQDSNFYRKSLDERDAQFRILLVVITSVLYFNALNCGFVYDDHRAILENPDVIDSSPTSWLRLFKSDFWGTPIGNSGSHKSYRPLVTLTFKVQYQLAQLYQYSVANLKNLISATEPEVATLDLSTEMALSFHLLNVLLHMLIVDLVYRLVASSCLPPCKLIPRQQQQQQQQSAQRNPIATTNGKRQRSVAMLTGLLFACHPIHVEAVTSLVGRAELMGSLFALLSFGSLIDYLSLDEENCEKNQQRCDQTSDSKRLVASLAFAACACLSKENCATVILINFALILWLHLVDNQRRMKSNSNFSRRTKSFVAMSLLVVAFVAFRLQLNSTDSMIGSATPKFSRQDNPLTQPTESLCRSLEDSSIDCGEPEVLEQVGRWMWMTRIYLSAFNFKLMTNPMSDLSYDWPLQTIGLIKSPFELRFILALCGYLSAVGVLVKWLITLISSHQIKPQDIASGCRRSISSYLTTIASKTNKTLAIGQHQQPMSRSASTSNFSDSEWGSDSETNSLDTLKSCDSGFVGATNGTNELKFQPSSSASPAPSSSSGVSTGSGSTCTESPEMCETIDQRATTCSSLNSFGWSLIWLLVPYFPASNLILSVGFLVAERTLYLPSVGFCLLMANLLVELLPRASASLRLVYRISGSCNANQMVTATAGQQEYNGFWCHANRLLRRFETITSAAEFKGRKMDGRQNGEEASGSERGRSKQLASDDIATANSLPLLLLVLAPLLILSATKIVARNADWRSDQTLYQSNLAQSPAKSLANLATLNSISNLDSMGSPGRSLAESLGKSIELYRGALELDPNSAELHYNLALALQRDRGDDSQTQHDGKSRNEPDDPIEYHYKLAIELRRRNFPLAALNLGARQYGRGQLAEAGRTFERCAFEMDARKAKVYNEHVRVQIECLISAAKLRLPRLANSENVDDTVKQISADSKQTWSGEFGPACEPKVFKWLEAARSLVAQLEEDNQSIATARQTLNAGQIGDLNKQLAAINWIEGKCAPEVEWRVELLASAAQLAAESQVASSADIYLDYANTLLDRDAQLASILKAIEAEGRKSNQKAEQVARLHYAIAKLEIKDQSSREAHLREAIRLAPETADYFNLAAQFAYERRDFEASESLYRKSLEILKRRPSGARKLAAAHVNFGAILQINGRLVESEQQYRQALELNPANAVARQNLASVTRRLAALEA